jgi:hypothetical protein
MKLTLGDANNDLKVLSIASYIIGGWAIVNGGFAILWYFGPDLLGAVSGNEDAISIFLNKQFWLLYGFVFLDVVCGIALLYSGRCLAKRIHFWRIVFFSFVGLFALPFGLAVGGITLLVMARKSVRAIFALNSVPN